MVTTTDDAAPTHDIYGTDLRRVMDLHGRGFAAASIGDLLGLDVWRVRYAIVVATGDREGAPSPEVIEERAAEIRARWPAEIHDAALRGERSQHVVISQQHRERVRSSMRRLRLEEVRSSAAGTPTRDRLCLVPVICRGVERWRVRAQVFGRGLNRTFASREEAETYGREWLAQRASELDSRGTCVPCE